MAFAFARHRFFGREIVNFVVTLPIILPGVITGVALASFFLFTGTDLSTRTVIIGHTTFCIVLVFNNVLARLRRLSPSLEEASRDLGASGVQTFRYVTFPSIRTALVAGALLSLALSFDEIAVTFFLAGADTTTLPLWILGAFRNSQAVPEVNAAATVILLISLPMIALAAYLMRDEGCRRRPAAGEALLAVVLGHELRARSRVFALGAVHDGLVRSLTFVRVVRQGLYVGGHAIWTKHAVRG